MKRAVLLLVCAGLLADCSSAKWRWNDLDENDFSPGTASQEQFFADAGACAGKAERKRDYTAFGVDADAVTRHRLYNKVYLECMVASGYREKEGWFDF